jgi:radical SAM protein with 4Fe4S-binding SPASM domain
MDDEIHDAFTRRKGSLQRTLRGIDLIHRAGIHVEVKCSVTQINRKHTHALHHFFAARGIKVDYNAQIRKSNGGAFDPSPLNISYEDKVDLNLFKIDLDGGVRERPEPTKAPEETRLCFAGINALYVAPDLKVYPCSAFPLQVGDLSTQSLKELWAGNAKLRDVRQMSRARTQGCSGCEARKYCGYCMGKAYLENDGDYTKPASITCADAFAWKDATKRYTDGRRSKPQAPPQPKALVKFNIRTSSGAAPKPKVTICGNC